MFTSKEQCCSCSQFSAKLASGSEAIENHFKNFIDSMPGCSEDTTRLVYA